MGERRTDDKGWMEGGEAKSKSSRIRKAQVRVGESGGTEMEGISMGRKEGVDGFRRRRGGDGDTGSRSVSCEAETIEGRRLTRRRHAKAT
jgi:hypothetical protein